MRLIAKYGLYTHDGLVTVSAQETVNRSHKGTAYSRVRTFTVSGVLYAGDSAALKTKIDSLITAYAVEGLDFKLTYPDGSTRTDLCLIAADCMGGTRVIQRPLNTGSGSAIYAVRYPYTLTLEGVEDLAPSATIVEQDETVQQAGSGGQVIVTRQPKHYPARLYAVGDYSTLTYTQSGRIVLWGRKVKDSDLPAPLWPDLEIASARQITHPVAAQRYGSVERWFEASYAYTFESPTPLEVSHADSGPDWPSFAL